LWQVKTRVKLEAIKVFLKAINSPAAFRLDIRSKLIISLLTAMCIVSTAKGNYMILLIYLAPVIAAVFIFRPGLFISIKRVFLLFLFPLSISIFIPFTNRGNIVYSINMNLFILNITDNGITIFFTAVIKAFLSIIIFTSLVISTKDTELLGGLRKIHLPKIMVSIIFLMYRYLFLIRDEAKAGQLAISSRVFQKSYHNVNKKLGYLAGSLFIKSFDRAENIYKSMESRGFEGEFYEVNNSGRDSESSNLSGWLIVAVFAIVLAVIKYIEFAKLLN
jgi:cobalt/nickel transport system permease protein